jgi:hypothetical protein
MRLRDIVGLLGFGVVACGGGSAQHVEISGMTPQAGAAVAAKAVCTHAAQCGSYAIECMGGGAAGGSGSTAPAPATTCMAVFDPVTYDKCVSDATPTLTQLLACPAITAADVDTLETCFDMLDAQACETAAEAAARAQAAATSGVASQREFPAACALLTNPPASCGFPPTR